MDPRELEYRLEEAEQKLAVLEEREKKLRNQVLRLTAVAMALSEKLQEKKILQSEQFEDRVQAHLKTLDREISDRRTERLLDELLGSENADDPAGS
ncbi:hypothetical protein LLH00_07640 [bacterium]|nr:hypothetical protein [bacterium]